MFFDMAKLFHFFTAKENQGQDSMFNAILMSVCHVCVYVIVVWTERMYQR